VFTPNVQLSEAAVAVGLTRPQDGAVDVAGHNTYRLDDGHAQATGPTGHEVADDRLRGS
jgi:hypothetical protein